MQAFFLCFCRRFLLLYTDSLYLLLDAFLVRNVHVLEDKLKWNLLAVCSPGKLNQLIDRVLIQGTHQIEWDGRDINSNEVVSDGVYFYTITIESIFLEGNETTAQAGYVYVFSNADNNTN